MPEFTVIYSEPWIYSRTVRRTVQAKDREEAFDIVGDEITKLMDGNSGNLPESAYEKLENGSCYDCGEYFIEGEE